MEPFSTLFTNPAVEILEGRLWEAARKRYLGEHPADQEDDAKSVMRKVKIAYKDIVTATLKNADQQVKTTWRKFKHIMMEELKEALTTVFQMSEVEWYAVEAGQLPYPAAIAVPFSLLKHMTTDVMSQFLRNGIEFENLDDTTVEAFAIYAANERFQEVLENARRNYEPIEIGRRGAQFVVAEIIKGDAYFLDEESHHSLIDMVILSSANGGSSVRDKKNQKAAVKKWFDQERKNRKNDRRFTGDGWEIGLEEMKSWETET